MAKTDRLPHGKTVSPLLAWSIIGLTALVVFAGSGFVYRIRWAVVVGIAFPLLIALCAGLRWFFGKPAVHGFIREHLGVLLALVAGAVGVGAYFWFFWTPLGKLVITPQYQGIIMDVHGITGKPLTNAWSVSRLDVRQFEMDLQKYVNANTNRLGDFIPKHLSEYRRRYYGYVDGTKRGIAATLEHPAFIPRNGWLRRIYWTAGGGYYIWNICYDTESRTFTNFFTNCDQ